MTFIARVRENSVRAPRERDTFGKLHFHFHSGGVGRKGKVFTAGEEDSSRGVYTFSFSVVRLVLDGRIAAGSQQTRTRT